MIILYTPHQLYMNSLTLHFSQWSDPELGFSLFIREGHNNIRRLSILNCSFSTVGFLHIISSCPSSPVLPVYHTILIQCYITSCWQRTRYKSTTHLHTLNRKNDTTALQLSNLCTSQNLYHKIRKMNKWT